MSVFSVAAGAQILAEIPTGVLADRFGRRPALVLGAVAGVGATLCYALGLNYWLLAAGATLGGLSFALFSGTEAALLHESLAKERLAGRYAEYWGRLGAAEEVAFAIAAIAGGVVAAVWSLQTAFWLTLAPQSLAVVAALRLHEPGTAERRAPRDGASVWRAIAFVARNPRLRLLAGAAALREGLGESSFQFRLTFFQMLWPTWALGIAQTITFAASALSYALSGRVIARVGAARVLVADLLLGRAVSITALLLPTLASPALMSLTSLTYGVTEVASSTLQQREFTDRQRATMASISAQVANLAFAFGAVALGLLADRIGVVRALLVAQVLLLSAAWLYLLLIRHGDSQSQSER